MLDLVGNRTLRDLRRVVAPGGRLVLSGGGNPGEGKYLGPVGLMAKGGLFGRLLGLHVQIPLASRMRSGSPSSPRWWRAVSSAR